MVTQFTETGPDYINHPMTQEIIIRKHFGMNKFHSGHLFHFTVYVIGEALDATVFARDTYFHKGKGDGTEVQ